MNSITTEDLAKENFRSTTRVTYNNINRIANKLGIELIKNCYGQFEWIATNDPTGWKIKETMGNMICTIPGYMKKLTDHTFYGWMGEIDLFVKKFKRQIRWERKLKRRSRMKENMYLYTSRREFYEYDMENFCLDGWDHLINLIFRD